MKMKHVKTLVAVFAVTVIAAGTFCVLPDKNFEQISIIAEAATTDTVTFSYSADGSTLTVSGTGAITAYPWQNDAEWSTFKKLVIGDGITSICPKAFYGAANLRSVVLPTSLQTMGSTKSTTTSGVFQDCRKLETVSFSGAANSAGLDIGYKAFYNTALTDIDFTGVNVTSIYISAFSYCPNLESISLKEGLKTIDNHAFESSGLTSIAIPDGVTAINFEAFKNCSYLKKVTMYDCSFLESDIFWGDQLLDNVTVYNSLLYPNAGLTIGETNFKGCTNLKSFTLDKGAAIITVGRSAFSGCSNLSNFILGEGAVVKSIGNFGFRYCSKLTDCPFNEGLTYIGENAFEDCTSLTSVTIPSTVTTIGSNSFEGCSSLQKLVINSSCDIFKETFRDCTALSDVKFNDRIQILGEGSFRNCKSLEKVTLPANVQGIYNYAFYGCTKLSAIENGYDTIESLGKNAFGNCVSLKSFVIPKYVRTVSEYCFSGCTSLADVKLNSMLTSIGDYAFKETAIIAMRIPEKVTSVGGYAFQDSKLEAVEITYQGTSLHSRSFYKCPNLKHIHIPSTKAVADYAGYYYLPTADKADYYVGDCGLGEACPLNGGSGEGEQIVGNGDLDGNGELGMSDLTLLAYRVSDPSLAYTEAGDMNGDGEIGMADLTLLSYKISSGK